MTADAARVGRRNRAKGKQYQLDCADWLRGHGFSNASYEVRNGTGDVMGIGDVNLECGDVGWDQVYVKMAQSARDADRKDVPIWCVWKKKLGKTDPGEGLITVAPSVWWAIIADYQAYQRADLAAELAYDKGYRAANRDRGNPE